MGVKLEDVARRAGLSKATVSLALNGSTRINAQTRARLQALAREMGYRPNPYARNLATRRSRQIGLIVPDIENVYYASLAQSIFNQLRTSDYGLSISVSMNSPELEHKIIRRMIENRMDALMLAPVNTPNEHPDYLSLLDEAGMPLLFVTADYPSAARPRVMCDLYGGMQLAMRALFERGYKRIAMLSGPENVCCLDLRTQGYVDFIESAALAYRRIYHLDGVRYEDAQAFVCAQPDLDMDALVCVNDMMALGALNALRARGVRVPEDMAVVGYDDVIFATVSPVPITTVRQDVSRISREAVKHILAMAAGEPTDSCMIPCELVRRASI